MKNGTETYSVPDVKAWCSTCDWNCMAKNAHAVGAQHARRHGHDVVVEVYRSFRYNYGERSVAS